MSVEMNLIEKLKYKDVFSRISLTEWDGSTDVSPYVVEFDPTAACDLACPGCISEDIIANGGRFTNDRILELSNEMIDSGVKAVILIGGGEPLTHPKIGEVIKLFGENDVQVGITTNGTLIDRYMEEISEYSSWTRVSIDAGSKGLFHKLRPAKTGKNLFNKIIHNMESLGKKKRGLMGYSYLLQSQEDGIGNYDNANDLFSAAKIAKDIGCDYFEVKPTYAFRGDIPHSLMRHSIEFNEKAKYEISRLEELEDDNFKILHAINLKPSINGVNENQPKEYEYCPSVNLRTLVTPKGVFACPYWRGKENFKIGDVVSTSFSDMWTNNKKKKVISELNPSKDCNFHCLRHETNLSCISLKNKGIDVTEISGENAKDRFI